MYHLWSHSQFPSLIIQPRRGNTYIHIYIYISCFYIPSDVENLPESWQLQCHAMVQEHYTPRSTDWFQAQVLSNLKCMSSLLGNNHSLRECYCSHRAMNCVRGECTFPCFPANALHAYAKGDEIANSALICGKLAWSRPECSIWLCRFA